MLSGGTSNRVFDTRRMAGAAVGAVVVLGLSILMALMFDGAMSTVVRYKIAAPCPSAEPSSGCVATLPADIVTTGDTYGDDEPSERRLGLDIPEAPVGTPHDELDGTVTAWLAVTDADRLGISDRADDDVHLTVTMFEGMVIDVTGPNGEVATTRRALEPKLAGLELFLWGLAVVLVLAVGARGYRQLTGRRVEQLPTFAAVGGGLSVGMVAVLAMDTIWVFVSGYVVAAVIVAALITRVLREPVPDSQESGS